MTECRTGKETEVDMLPVEGLFKVSAIYTKYILWELRQSCVIVVAVVVVVSFFAFKTFY